MPYQCSADDDKERSQNAYTCTGDKEKNYSVWMNGFVDLAHQVAVNQNTYFNFTSEGVVLGFNYQGIPGVDTGGVIATAFSQIADGNRMGSSDIVYGATSFYANYYLEDFYLKGAFWGVFHQIDNRRDIAYSNIDTQARGKINGWQIDPHLEGGYIRELSGYEFQVYAAFDCVVNWEGGFTEKGAGNLNVYQKSNSSSMLQSVLGLKFFQKMESRLARYGFKEGVSYINRTPFGTGTVTTSIFGSSDFVTLKSFTQTQNLGSVELVFFAEMGRGRDVITSIAYEGQFGSQYISNQVMLTLSKSF